MRNLTPEDITLVSQLRQLAADNLLGPERTRTLAWDLISKADYYKKLSDKQMDLIRSLIARATTPPDRRETIDIGHLGGVVQLFDKAKKHLKFPAIVLNIGSDDDGTPYLVRLYPAGEQASVPGAINVTEYDDAKAKYEQLWYGRILRNGKFEISPKVQRDENAKSNVEFAVEQLKAFADDPVGVAAAHGQLTGRCCFCHLPLRDERSTAVGYGPTCAGNWELPWGKGPLAFAEPAYEAPKPVRKARPRNIRIRS